MTPDNKLGISRWFDLPNGDALTEAVTNLNKKDLAHIDVNFVRSRISSYEEGEQITKKQAVQLENHLRNIQGKRKIIS